MAWNPIIPGYRDVRGSIFISYSTAAHHLHSILKTPALKKMLSPILILRLERLFSWRANRTRVENGWRSFREEAVFTIFCNFGIPMKKFNSDFLRSNVQLLEWEHTRACSIPNGCCIPFAHVHTCTHTHTLITLRIELVTRARFDFILSPFSALLRAVTQTISQQQK